MFLYIATSVAKDVSHLGFFGKEMVYIYLKLFVDLELLALKGWIFSICKE